MSPWFHGPRRLSHHEKKKRKSIVPGESLMNDPPQQVVLSMETHMDHKNNSITNQLNDGDDDDAVLKENALTQNNSFFEDTKNDVKSRGCAAVDPTELCQSRRSSRLSRRVPRKKKIIVECRSSIDLSKMIQSLGKEADKKELSKMIQSLGGEADKKELSCCVSSKRRQNTRPSSQQNDILFVYPFHVEEHLLDNIVTKLSKPFHRLSATSTSKSSISASTQNDEAKTDTSSGSRKHYLTVNSEDRHWLEHEEFLNDTLVDFWMRWIWQKEDPKTSTVYFFTSHFFTTLQNDGPKAVSSWTSNKEIDVFSKNLVFFPINENFHWSLCVVVNAGHIENFYSTDKNDEKMKFPCIFFLDSLKAHRMRRVSNTIRKWLERLKEKVITKNEAFQFDGEDIRKLQEEMGILVDELALEYKKKKETHKKRNQESQKG